MQKILRSQTAFRGGRSREFREQQAGGGKFSGNLLGECSPEEYAERMSDGVTRENEQFLDAQVAAGAYPGRAEALNAAIDLLRLRTELVARIDEGCRQLDAGDYDELAVEDLTAYFAGLLPQSTDSFLNSQP